MKKEEKAQWSYTEIIIIAVVFSIFAIRVVPRYTKANPESRIGELIDGLLEMRTQLDLYRAQHEGSCPVDSFESFQTALTTKIGRCCPHVKKIPANPFNNLNTVRFDGKPAGIGKAAGWRLDTKTGLFQADDSVAHAGL